jgi:DNA-binding NarL/FixJ family response regulator
MQRTIRVAVANRPRLVRELILATIGDLPNIEIVAEIQDQSQIPIVIERMSPEFLIIAFDTPDQRLPLCDTLLRLHPEMKILALGSEGNCSIFYWASLNIHARVLETSDKGIIRALRSHFQAVKLHHPVIGIVE